MRHAVLAFLVVPGPLLAACGGDEGATQPGVMAPDAGLIGGGGAGAQDGSAGAPSDPGQTPPQGRAGLDPWLDAGHYKAWRCEQAIMDARPKGAHGRNRVCSNELLSGAVAAPYPVGAAAVKEIFDAQDKMVGLAVALKIVAGTGPSTWYWYERLRGSTAADGVAVPLCAGCHGQAQVDNIFVRVR